ncbi:MAG: choice-of-anchor E domain-containing protein [Phycisphaerales bacterium]
MSRKVFIFTLIAVWASLIQGREIAQTRYFGEIAQFDQFDSSLGNLNTIKIDVSANISGGQLIYDNDSSGPLSGTFEFGKVCSLTYTQDVSLHNSANQMIFDNGNVFACNSSAFNLAPDDGDGRYNYDSNPPDGSIYYGGNLSFSATDYIGRTYWDKGSKGFIGSGTFDIVYSVNQWINFIGNDLGEKIEYYCSPNVEFQGSVTVTYSYDAVPEPCSFSLFLAGMALYLNKMAKR